MDYAVLLLLVSAAAVGIVSAVARTWSLHSRLYSLEDRVSVLEGVTQREVKIRAAEGRWKKPSIEEEAIKAALANPGQPQPVKWWDAPHLKKGAYVP